MCLPWKDPLLVTITSYSQGHIDSKVREGDKDLRFTRFYGNPDSSLRHQSWELLSRLAGLQELKKLPWLVGGDFNEICCESEKWGGNLRPSNQMQRFRDVLNDCALQDLHYTGEFFTCDNRRKGTNLILECFDRFVGTLEWKLLFPTAYVQSLEFFHSDHRPLYIQFGLLHLQGQYHAQHHNQMLRFEACWLREPDCADLVEHGLKAFDDSLTLIDRISYCLQTLDKWAGAKFRTLPNQIKKTRAKLNELTCPDKWFQFPDQVINLEKDLESMLTKEEEYWQQRSRVD